MKRKILWMLLSFLLVAALVLASCAEEEVVGEEEEEEEEGVGEEEEEEVVPAVGEPQYGGTLTLKFTWIGDIGADSWDAAHWWYGYAARQWGSPYLPFLLLGDIEKYGPRGTNEYTFNAWECVPEAYLGGSMAESWEWTTPLTLVFNIRQGVSWTGREGVMDAREFTAYDVEYSLNRTLETWVGLGAGGFEYIDSITATDRYTVVIELNEFYADWAFHFGYGWLAPIYPEEVVEAGSTDWRNQVGTGPFILTDHVEGSQATFERNPTYWDTTTINGKEYPLPFVDKLIFPVVDDMSTLIAAVRTGAVDWATAIPLLYEETLSATAPDLIKTRYLTSSFNSLGFQCDQEPWNNRNVRRALMIGTDLEAMRDAIWLEGELHAFPLSSLTPYLTPLDELPESARVLYTYNPDLCKDMLAQEGFPEHLKMKIYANTGGLNEQDVATMLKAQWAEYGIEVEVVVEEWSVISGKNADRTLEDAWAGTTMVNTTPFIVFWALAVPEVHDWYWSGYDDPVFLEMYYTMLKTRDVAERTELIKEMSIYFLEDVAFIPMCGPYILNCHWPWVKNYYGETECGYYNWQVPPSLIWIDQDLKELMGY